MNAFSLTPSSLLSKNDASLRNPSLSYIWWFYFCLFLLEQFINAWFAQALKGHITGKRLKTHSISPPTALLLQAAAKAACFYAFLFLLPVNGSMYSFIVI